MSIGADASVVFYQGSVRIAETGTSPLPFDCLASAVIRSTGGAIMAVVNDTD